MYRLTSSTLIGAAVAIALSSNASALNTRTWVSGTGTDQASCGPIVSPCRTLQFAHDQTSAGGTINFKDSAGYGSVVITKALNIIADGVMAGVLAAPGGNAIEINAGLSDTVVLRGLTVDGANVGGNGVVLNAGAVLDVDDCIVQNFIQVNQKGSSGNGILLQPVSGTPRMRVRHTLVTHNSGAGLIFSGVSASSAISYPNIPTPTPTPTATTIIIDRVTAVDNLNGVAIQSAIGGALVNVIVSATAASGNSNSGMSFVGSTKANIDFSHADQNGTSGFQATGNAVVTIGRSVASGNGSYGLTTAAQSSSYGDNRFLGNALAPTNGTISPAQLN